MAGGRRHSVKPTAYGLIAHFKCCTELGEPTSADVDEHSLSHSAAPQTKLQLQCMHGRKPAYKIQHVRQRLPLSSHHSNQQVKSIVSRVQKVLVCMVTFEHAGQS